MTGATQRLPAAERRRAIVATAREVFSEGGFRGATTAEIARRAGVSEPILYRHFQCKRDLYLAALTEAWTLRRAVWDEAIAAEPDPVRWPLAMVEAVHGWKEMRGWDLWFQAIGEASDDPEVRATLAELMQEVHAYLSAVFRRVGEATVAPGGRDPEAAAWAFMSLGLLVNATKRLGVPLPVDIHARLLAGQLGAAR